jgi:hypothetical protein
VTKLETGLRDHPAALIGIMVALAGGVLGLGYLTARIGSGWARVYAHRYSRPDWQ